ncbi:hypothetical protein LMG28614_03160 [Paraburkholderia ultramafica]|uniref:Uncharacterized protein n=1 Tax=Paraburkholderia ultramafica TaxID=1544867 RepID=A0A6S7BGT7_9BURK|nr:hypothetical protein [Paraburkholderia ultramafica]CAB3790806.1 hypothetical protein LMG28614_03160 [Paraburkholderia ultramafica]
MNSFARARGGGRGMLFDHIGGGREISKKPLSPFFDRARRMR